AALGFDRVVKAPVPVGVVSKLTVREALDRRNARVERPAKRRPTPLRVPANASVLAVERVKVAPGQQRPELEARARQRAVEPHRKRYRRTPTWHEQLDRHAHAERRLAMKRRPGIVREVARGSVE